MTLPIGGPERAPDAALRFLLRDLEVVLEGHPPDQHDLLGELVSHSSDRCTPEASLRIRLTRTGERGREVVEQNGPTRRVCCDEVALGYILYRLQTRLVALHDEGTAIHCAAASLGGRLALFTGDRGAGKTTLLLRLMLDGAAFHCDEIVVAQDGMATTLPRRMHVKEGTLACIPEVADVCADKLLLKYGAGPRFYAVDPVELGCAWESASGRPAVIFHLTPAFDQPPSLEPLPQIEMVKRLMCQTLSGRREIGRQAADICSMVNGVPCFALHVGALHDTAALVRRTFDADRLSADGVC